MASYTFIPSSLVSDAPIQNPSNAYADTSSNNYASAQLSRQNATAYLGGFSISISSSEEASTATVKVKASLDNSTVACGATLMSASDGVALSNTVSLTTTATVYTFTLTASAQTVASYASTLCIMFEKTDTSYSFTPVNIYGAEVIVETEAKKCRNKIVFGNTVLIDLTSDTVTTADVATGKTFHLPNGLQATGTLSPSVATATTTGSTTRTVSFTNLTKQPSWFMMICSSTNTTARNARVQHMLYDGTTTTTYYGNGSTAGSISTSTSYGSFSYSSGTLTITVTTAYIGAADWALYYL